MKACDAVLSAASFYQGGQMLRHKTPSHAFGEIPIVSIVVPCFWFNQIYFQDPIR